MDKGNTIPFILEVEDMNKIEKLGNINGYTGGSFSGMVYDAEGLAPTITTYGGGNREPMITNCECVGGLGEKHSNNNTQYFQHQRVYKMGNVSLALQSQIVGGSYNYLESQKDDQVYIKQATEKGEIACKVGGLADLNYPASKTRRGRVQGNGEISPTLTTENTPSVLEPWKWEINGEVYKIRIRKLTPKECWRLMGFTDEDFKKAEKVNSNTQLYKQAGNSIVVPVLEAIFSKMMAAVQKGEN